MYEVPADPWTVEHLFTTAVTNLMVFGTLLVLFVLFGAAYRLIKK